MYKVICITKLYEIFHDCGQNMASNDCGQNMISNLFLKGCRSGGEPLATLSPIWKVLTPLAPETNALPLDQLAAAQNHNPVIL